MYRLIATDLDGTLLHTDKTLPTDFMDVAGRLMEKGVVFVAASGRQYDNIYETLSPLSDGMYILAENGGINGHGREVTDRALMTPESIGEVLAFIRSLGGRAHAVCCCDHEGLYLSDDEKFVEEMSRYYLRRRRIKSEKEEIPACKIAIYCYGKSEEIYEELTPPEGTEKVISGVDWVDVAPIGVNKGVALAEVLKKTGIRPEECLAFGDNFNDKEMLELCGEKYVVSNAPAGMRALFPAIGSNDEDAVTKKLREILNG